MVITELNYHYILVKYYSKYNVVGWDYGGKVVTLQS